ncbi:ABC transporter ATP-binding protein [Tardiphaga sp. 866_E4_N2_1]|uniref:ABC transporter ATP-binding protein n=1 Tax=unclassified Tardiphaga TaxID=2631404 RepID=UPI003F249B14
MLLKLAKVCACYGPAQILYDVDLELRAGEVVALIGRNGAGKSTTLRTIMGLIQSASGSIAFREAEISRLLPYQIARQRLGYVPEERRIFTDLTVAENLEVGRRSAEAGRIAWTPERLYEIFPNLAEMRQRQAGFMSGGEQQMLTIARTLMGNPIAVLLDEPSEGIAPVIVDQMSEAILRMKEVGISVLLSEQNIGFAGAISDRAYIIDRGHIRYTGTASSLLTDEDVKGTFLAV